MKVHISNHQETHPKPEQPAELVNWTTECGSRFLPTLLLGSMWSTELNRIKCLQRSHFQCEGFLWRQNYSSFQLHSDSAMSNTAVQLTLLFENSMRYTHVSTYLCNSASGTISVSALLLCWQSCRGRGKGHVKHLEFGTFSPASNSSVHETGFLSCVCSGASLYFTMCMKYSASECEQPRTPDTEIGGPQM